MPKLRHRIFFRRCAICLPVCIVIAASSLAQKHDENLFFSNFKLSNSLRFILEKTGAGLEISPDNTLNPPAASFPFNSGVNAGFNLAYKFLNLSISKSIESSTKNSSLAFSTKFYKGASLFGGQIGFYNNVASLDDKKTLNVESSIKLFKLSPYWMINTNPKRFSLAAVTDYSQLQTRSAGSFIFEINPFFIVANGRNGHIIPNDPYYHSIFENQAGLRKITIVNFDFRPGYAYTKVFEQGEYFISGGLFLGPGFGYHSVKAIERDRGLHWQSSVRMSASAGMNREKYFIVAAFRYTNSFTPVKTMGILSDEGTLALTFGLRFGYMEDRLPKNFGEMLKK